MNSLLRKNHLLLFSLLLFAIHTKASDIVEILPVSSTVLRVHFQDGHIDYGTGFEDSNLKHSPLNISRALATENYMIQCVEDPLYRRGKSPVYIGRKSKGRDFHNLYDDPKFISEHYIYLELPSPLQKGKTYQISFNGLAENRSTQYLIFNPAELRSPSIHVNQIGFTPSAPKYAYMSHWMGDFSHGKHQNGALSLDNYIGKKFYLLDQKTKEVVFNGIVEKRKSLADGSPMTSTPYDGKPNGVEGFNYTYADVFQCNFSSFSTSGSYEIVVENLGKSFPFEINDAIYHKPFYQVLKGLFYQRQGIVQELPDGKLYPRDHHPEDIGENKFIYDSTWRYIDKKNYGYKPQNTGLLPTWGWYHDAGDWDTYPHHMRIPIELNILYSITPEKFADGDVANRYKLSDKDQNWIEEGKNGLPDLLDEASWLINYFYRTKAEAEKRGLTNGGVPGGYSGVDAGVLDGFPSWGDQRELMFSAQDPMVSYYYAAATALFSHNLSTHVKGFNSEAEKWKKEALSTYRWAQQNTLSGDDGKGVKEIRMVASAALYQLTSAPSYQDQLKKDILSDSSYIKSKTGWYNTIGWELAAAIYTQLPKKFKGLDHKLQTEIKNKIVSVVEKDFIATAKERGYRFGFDWEKDNILGLQSTPHLILPIAAHAFSGKTEYLNVIQTTCDFHLGGNPLDLVWITGLGDQSLRYPFQVDSWYLKDFKSPAYDLEIVPGIVNYASWTRGDWFSGSEFEFSGDEDFSQSSAYPSITDDFFWPYSEAHFSNRYSIPGGEFTVWQSMGPAAFAYGYLKSETPVKNAMITPRPTVTLQVRKDDLSQKSLLLSAQTSDNVVKVKYYYDWHLVGESLNTETDFALSFDSSRYSPKGEVLITAVAIDQYGNTSRYHPETEQKIIFD